MGCFDFVEVSVLFLQKVKRYIQIYFDVFTLSLIFFE